MPRTTWRASRHRSATVFHIQAKSKASLSPLAIRPTGSNVHWRRLGRAFGGAAIGSRKACGKRFTAPAPAGAPQRCLRSVQQQLSCPQLPVCLLLPATAVAAAEAAAAGAAATVAAAAPPAVQLGLRHAVWHGGRGHRGVRSRFRTVRGHAAAVAREPYTCENDLSSYTVSASWDGTSIAFDDARSYWEIRNHDTFCASLQTQEACEQPQCEGGTHVSGATSGSMCFWNPGAGACVSSNAAGYYYDYAYYSGYIDMWDCECTDIDVEQCPNPPAFGCKLVPEGEPDGASPTGWYCMCNPAAALCAAFAAAFAAAAQSAAAVAAAAVAAALAAAAVAAAALAFAAAAGARIAAPEPASAVRLLYVRRGHRVRHDGARRRRVPSARRRRALLRLPADQLVSLLARRREHARSPRSLRHLRGDQRANRAATNT